MGEQDADEEPCKRIENLAKHSTFNLCVRTGVSILGEGKAHSNRGTIGSGCEHRPASAQHPSDR